MVAGHDFTTAAMGKGINSLPNEVLENIFSRLPLADLGSLSQCSPRFNLLTSRPMYRSIDGLSPARLVKFARTIIAAPSYGTVVRKWKITLPEGQIKSEGTIPSRERREQCGLSFMASLYNLLSRALIFMPNLEILEVISPYGVQLPPHFFNPVHCVHNLEELHFDGPAIHHSMVEHPSFRNIKRLSLVAGTWNEVETHSVSFPASFAPELKHFYGPPQILCKLLKIKRPLKHISLIAARSAALPFIIASLKRLQATGVPLRQFTLRSERPLPLEEIFLRLGMFAPSLRAISLSLNEPASPFLDTEVATRDIEPIVETFLATAPYLTTFKITPSSDSARRRAYGISTPTLDYQRTSRWKMICPSLSHIVLPSSRRASFTMYTQVAAPAPPPGLPDFRSQLIRNPCQVFRPLLTEPPWSTNQRRVIVVL